jgi:hypothetical protein
MKMNTASGILGIFASAVLLTGCVQMTPEQRARFAEFMRRQNQMNQQQAQLNNEQSAAIAAQFAPKLEVPPMTMSHEFPNNQRAIQAEQQMPSGLGLWTGRTSLGTNGVTYYEISDINGGTYWTNVHP